MSKKILKFDTKGNYDFLLSGLVCGHKDYKLCFEINHHLGLNFTRAENILLDTGRPVSNTSHSYYFSKGNDNEIYHIISNRDHGGTGFYVPEMRNIDFFLLVSDFPSNFNMKKFVAATREIEIISGVYEIDPNNLKSAETFLLFLEK